MTGIYLVLRGRAYVPGAALACTAVLAITFCSPPLFAAARIAKSNVTTPTEVVNWTAGVSYSYDHAGNITQIGSDRFFYDRASRLVQVDVNGVTRTYAYDAFGNRVECTHMPGMPEQSDCQYGITIDANTNRIRDVEYDHAGNVETFAGHRYTYDDANMAKRDDGPSSREFVYTADDERIAVYDVGREWNWTIRDLEGKVLRELSSDSSFSTWTWKRDHVFRDGLLLASRHLSTSAKPVTYYYHLDHLGSPRRVTDHNNRIVGFRDFFAFGPEVPGGLTEDFATPLRYTGHERDQLGNFEGLDTLDYMHARLYSAALGRFLSVDPSGQSVVAGTVQSWNRYTYALNNPFKFFDPDGEKWKVYTTIGFSTKTKPVEIDPRSVDAYEKYLDHELGDRLTKGPIVMGMNAPEAFDRGLADPDGLSVFIGHGYTDRVGVFFTDAQKSNFLENVNNRNPLVCLAGCGSAAFAQNMGINSETQGRAFVGFAGNVNAAFLTRISAQFVTLMDKGMTVGDAVNKLRKEYKAMPFRIVLIGDITVKATRPAGACVDGPECR